MNVIEIRNLHKQYGSFSLQDVSFGVKQGFITGLIGPNGSGKSTLIKMIMNIVVPDSGEIAVFGQKMPDCEKEIKQRIAFVPDESYYYEDLTIAEMKRIIAPFYKRWSEDVFQGYLEQFELPANKKIKDLSKGMKMKFSLALALSHETDLLIMDEPTAGLDPVFRRELLDILAGLILDEQKSILFSTHITTDLDRIADYITFLNRGQIVFSEAKDNVLERYVLVKGNKELLDRDTSQLFVGIRETGVGFEGLAANRSEAASQFGAHAVLETPSLEDIMFFTVKGGGIRA
ncbi:ABC transporter ATP-binding protein [Brevibacillus massiliensis]|uniref:ABC transporter ATP-binding protein n=1 Tax=Brevibacillus massiliensis TaxID=1118054 RepID=UPI0003041731|nr:ABC transporter ATP-binding protein [Brevibacillus massiliensis]